MSEWVIVPNELCDAINRAIDSALDGRPCNDEERGMIYSRLLSHFNDHGVIPDFSLVVKEPCK